MKGNSTYIQSRISLFVQLNHFSPLPDEQYIVCIFKCFCFCSTMGDFSGCYVAEDLPSLSIVGNIMYSAQNY